MTVIALDARHDESARQLLLLRKTLGDEVKALALRLAFDSILANQPAESPSAEELDKGINLAIALLYHAAHDISAQRVDTATAIRAD